MGCSYDKYSRRCELSRTVVLEVRWWEVRTGAEIQCSGPGSCAQEDTDLFSCSSTGLRRFRDVDTDPWLTHLDYLGQ